MRRPGMPLVCAACALAGLAATPVEATAQDNHGGTIVILKDPTPRPPDLEKIYGKPADGDESAAARKVKQYDQQRFALISHASGQVESLAETLQKAMAQEQSDAVLTQEAKVAAAIEVLAADVHMALQNEPEKSSKRDEKLKPTHKPQTAAELAQLRSRVDVLKALADGMHDEVAKSGPDTLPIGVLTKSVQIRDMARELKLRMRSL